MTIFKKIGCTRRTWILVRGQRLNKLATKSKITKEDLQEGFESLRLLQQDRHSSLLKLVALLILIAVFTIAGIFTPYGVQQYFIALDAVVLIYLGWYSTHHMFIEEQMQFWYMLVEIIEDKYNDNKD